MWRDTTTSGVHRPGLIPRILNSIGRRDGALLRLRDEGVDSLDKRADDLRPPGVVPAQLPGHVAPESQQTRPDVASQSDFALDLGHGPRGLPPPQLELEQTVARDVVPLREEQVVLIPGIDMCDSPLVAQDFHGRGQAGDGQLLRPAMDRDGQSQESASQEHIKGEMRRVFHGSARSEAGVSVCRG